MYIDVDKLAIRNDRFRGTPRAMCGGRFSRMRIHSARTFLWTPLIDANVSLWAKSSEVDARSKIMGRRPRLCSCGVSIQGDDDVPVRIDACRPGAMYYFIVYSKYQLSANAIGCLYAVDS